MLTGDFKTEIDCLPQFPFKERHMLRAQLARIQQTTQIVPAKLYEIDEETKAIK